MLLNRNPQVNEQVAVYGALAGVGVDLIPEHLRIEANGGYFDRGTNPLFFGTTVGPMGLTFTDFPVATYGGTLQVSAFKRHLADAVGRLPLYQNDPMVSASRYFTRPAYLPGFNWLASARVHRRSARRCRTSTRPNSTKTQLAYAGDVNLRAQFGHVRLRGDFETRSLELHPHQPAVAGAVPGLPGGLADRLRALRRRRRRLLLASASASPSASRSAWSARRPSRRRRARPSWARSRATPAAR